MRFIQIAVFSVAVNAWVLKRDSIAPQKPDSLPENFDKTFQESADLGHYLKRRAGQLGPSSSGSDNLSREGGRETTTSGNEVEIVQKLKDQIQVLEDRLWKCFQGRSSDNCVPEDYYPRPPQETKGERVIEPEDEDWAVQEPYDGPTGDADTQGSQRAHYLLNLNRYQFARTLKVNLENAAYFLKGFWSNDKPNYEQYFTDKKSYIDLVGSMESLGINLRPGSDAKIAYDKCHDEIQRIEEFSREQCRQKDQMDDICLHFDAEAYKQTAEEFNKKVDEKLDLFKTVDPSIREYPELKGLEYRAKELTEIGVKFIELQNGIIDELERNRYRVQDVLIRFF